MPPHKNGLGLPSAGPQLMAILNLTPDSFSDEDGQRLLDDKTALLRAAEAALTHGACVLDIGGESTRPGATPVPVEEETARILPAIRALHEAFPAVCLSVDTSKAVVARAALEAGARLVNDVSGLTWDPAMASVVAEYEAGLVIMHSQGTPETMQHNPTYTDVVSEVSAFLQRQAAMAVEAGVKADCIWLDPGFGFGKTIEHNLALLKALPSLVASWPYPVLAGLSRKGFLTLGQPILPAQRDELTAAAVVLAAQAGVHLHRVHNVPAMAAVLKLYQRARV